MGQHTWFKKSKKLFNELDEIYDKLNAHEHGVIYLDMLEVYQLENKADRIDEDNETDYHDVFRTLKRNIDNTYCSDIISSKEECFKWIEDNIETIYYYTDNWKEKLNEFWDEYPEGLIFFG